MFVRTRTIKGRPYRYLETRWRQGGKVRSKSVYLGAGSSALSDGPVPDHGRGQHGYDEFAVPEAPTATPAPTAPAPDAPSASAPEPGPQEGQSPDAAEGTAP